MKNRTAIFALVSALSLSSGTSSNLTFAKAPPSKEALSSSEKQPNQGTQDNQEQLSGMKCCAPGMADTEEMHGFMIAFTILGGVLLASIAAAFIALTVFLLRRSRAGR